MIARHIKPRVLEALEDTRIVVLQGARQVGKTTLVREISDERAGRLVTLDDPATLARAAADPMGFLQEEPERLLVIDEVQRLPELILPLKYLVDRDTRPGRFLLTGSANLLRLPSMPDSLAGRVERIELHGFSQGEIAGHRESFVDRLLAGERFTTHESVLHRHHYLQRAASGGYPEALARPEGRRRDAWFDNYADGIVRREAEDLTNLQRLAELPKILRVLASRNSAELNMADVARDTEIPVRTLAPYVDLLQTLYLIQTVPAWSSNATQRAIERPKVSLLDSGLAARLVNVSAAGASPDANPAVAGGLLEGFVAGEIRRQLTWSEERAQLCHFRQPSAGEVDIVLETPDGRVAGIEVKATSAPGRNDAKGLGYLRDRLGSRFVAGLILNTGTTGGSFGDRLAAVPMDAVWTT